MAVLGNAKHELFAQHVALGTGLEAAYIKSGYAPSAKNAARLRKNEGISIRIEELLRVAAEKVGASLERTLEEMVRLAYSDIGLAVDWTGAMVTLKDSSALPPEVRAAVSEVKQTKDGVAIKFHSKTAALEMLARYFGMSKEKLEITGANGGAIQVRRIDRVIVDPNPKR